MKHDVLRIRYNMCHLLLDHFQVCLPKGVDDMFCARSDVFALSEYLGNCSILMIDDTEMSICNIAFDRDKHPLRCAVICKNECEFMSVKMASRLSFSLLHYVVRRRKGIVYLKELYCVYCICFCFCFTVLMALTGFLLS